MPKKKQDGRRFVASATITNVDLTRTKSAIRVRVFDNGKKLGELELGRGSLMWFSKGKRAGKRIRWSKVAELFDAETATRKRRKKS